MTANNLCNISTKKKTKRINKSFRKSKHMDIDPTFNTSYDKTQIGRLGHPTFELGLFR